jgi:2-keto-3-deoxy-L-rhamnonate aldolase
MEDATKAGANYLLVLPPAYFQKKKNSARHSELLHRYFDISQASSLPIVRYNFPDICNGIDMDSDLSPDRPLFVE